MEVYSKPKTDEQYVESIRTQISRSKRFIVFHILGAIFFLALFLWAGMQVCRLDQIMPEFSEGAGRGFFIGVQLGLVAGLFFIFAFMNINFTISYFRGYRTERLMLKYYDELKKKENISIQEVQSTSQERRA